MRAQASASSPLAPAHRPFPSEGHPPPRRIFPARRVLPAACSHPLSSRFLSAYLPPTLSSIKIPGPLPALRATFSRDAPGIPRFAPVRGAAPRAKTYSQASFFPASSRTSSGPSGHLPRARGRLRALSRSQMTEKYEPKAFSPQGEGGPRSGGRGPWTCRIRTKQMTSSV